MTEPSLAVTGPIGELQLVDGNGAARTLLDPEERPAPPLRRPPARFAWPTWLPNGGAVLVSTVEYGAAGESPALLLRCPIAGGPVQVLYQSPSETSNVAPGAPHYLNPSPNGEHVLLLMQAAQTGLVLVFVDAAARGPANAFARGAPLFSAWSPRNDAVLLHVGGELSLMELATAPATQVLAANHVSYRAPAWSPDGDRIAVIAGDGRRTTLQLLDRAGKGLVSLAPCEAGVLAWAPDGATIAHADSRRGTPSFANLRLTAADGAGSRPAAVPTCLAFCWSPDGTMLAVLHSGPRDGYVAWSVVDRAGHLLRRFPAFHPSAEFALYVSFFDQYALSHRLWSPDGRLLVGCGRMPSNGTPPELLPSTVFVHDVAGGDARPLTAGAIASWPASAG